MTTGWQQLPGLVRDQVLWRIGPVEEVVPVDSGRNHHLAVVLHTATGAMFVKGIRTDDRRAARLRLEAAVADIVAGISPQLRWYLPDTGGWALIAFDAILNAWPADLHAAGDLALVTQAMHDIAAAGRTPPALVTDRIEQRWAAYTDPDQAALLRGEHLLHTDLRPDNILVQGHRAWIIDWSWPTRGAPWIDPAVLALWLIAEGHTPSAAEAWLHQNTEIPAPALDTFVDINQRLWAEIAADDHHHHHHPWKQRLVQAATAWRRHRVHQ